MMISCYLSWILCTFQSGLLLWLINKLYVLLLTFIFALGGGAIGAVSGAIKGQTTETGFARGLGVGAVVGAITAIQLATGESFSKVAVIHSLLEGKIYVEWVTPALLKACQSQETGLREYSDIFHVNTSLTITDLPVRRLYNSDLACAICLQDMKSGEYARTLPKCKHLFHVHCIDQWLMRQGSCPICRKTCFN